MLTLKLVLVIVALVLFALSAASVPMGRFNATAGGLFCWLLAETFA